MPAARDLDARDVQPPQDGLHHLRPLRLMTDEVAVPQRGRLSDVVQQPEEPQVRVCRSERVRGVQGVVQGVAWASLRLGDSAQSLELGQYHRQQAKPFHELKGPRRRSALAARHRRERENCE